MELSSLAEANDAILVKDIALDEGITMLDDPEHIVVRIEAPTIEEVEEVEEEAEPEEAAKPKRFPPRPPKSPDRRPLVAGFLLVGAGLAEGLYGLWAMLHSPQVSAERFEDLVRWAYFSQGFIAAFLGPGTDEELFVRSDVDRGSRRGTRQRRRGRRQNRQGQRDDDVCDQPCVGHSEPSLPSSRSTPSASASTP